MFEKKQKQFRPAQKSHVPLKSQAFAEREQKQRASLFLRVLFDILCLAFVGVAIFILFFSPFLQITKVVVQGNSEIVSKDIEQVIDARLSGRYLKAVPKNNFILFSNRQAENAIKSQFKKIANVTIIKKFPDTLTATITERQSLLVWCAGEACYLIDENGIAYATADFASPEITENHLVKLTDTSGKSVALGDKVLGSDFLSYVSQIRDSLKAGASIEVSEEYSTPAAVSGEADVVTPGGLRLLFSMSYPLDEAVKNLKLFLVKQNFPQPLEDHLEYIDLRSENKIFYKLKNAPENSDQTANSDNQQQPSSSDDKKNKKKR